MVDSLAVRIVTDNQLIKFIPTEKRDGLTIERNPGGNLSKDAPPSVELIGEWGLSMHAQSRRGNEVRNTLIDFGYQSQTLLNNMSILKIDPTSIDVSARTGADLGLRRRLGVSEPRRRASLAASRSQT
jgi:7,8-dihydropterin-6-yl-methyl-4-(beta-D-ribofuranosyl)aminobenzene 5'-phosphate synthase